MSHDIKTDKMFRSFRNLRIAGVVLIFLCCFSQAAKAQAPTAAFDANDTIVCISNTVSFIDMSLPGNAAITGWSWTFGDGGTSSIQNPNYAYATGGNFTVKLVVTNANGLQDSITHIIYVLVAQTINNTIRICSPQSSTTIMAVDPGIAGVTGTWFTASSGVIASPANDTTLISNLISGTYLFFWVVSDGTCSEADQVTVIVDQPVVVNAGTDQNICTTPGTATMAGSNPAPGTGLWTTTSAATISNPANGNTPITGLTSPGTYVFVWTVTNGACVIRDSMNIIVSNPVASAAGADQLVCASPGTATLAGSSPAPGSGLWTTTSSATISNPTSATSTVSGLTTAGVYTFIWTVTNGACVSRDTMLMTVSTAIVANAGNNQQICTTTASGLLSGNNPSPGTGLWTALNGGTITNPTNSVTTVTGLITSGFYNFVWTITNGPCVSRDTVVFIVRNPVIANAGPDQQFCNATTATLTGNSPAPGIGAWTTSSGATIASPSSATTTVSGLSVGLNTFIYTTTYGACVSRDTIIIRVDALIISNAGPDIQICESQTSVTMAGNNPAPGTGVWTKLNGGTITTPSSPTTTITALTPGNHLFIWTITNGTCISRDTMRVTVNVQIPSNAGLDQQICQGASISLSGNNPIPATGLWTTPSSAIIANPTNPSTAVSGLTNAGAYVFVWTVTNGACVLRDTVRITVDSAIVANAGPDQNLCALTAATLAGNAPATGTASWSSLGSAVVTNVALANSGVTNLAIGNNLLVWTITNGNCISRDTINIVVSTLIASNAGSDQQICASSPSATLSGNSPAPGSGNWTTSSSAIIANPNNPSSAVSGLNTAGTYSFIWTITNGACVSRDTMSITVSGNVIATAGPDQNLCNVTTATLSGNAAAPGTGLWTSTTGGAITTNSNPNSGVTGLIVGTNTFVWTITNGACVTRDTVNIIVSTLIPAIAGPDQQLCLGNALVLAGNTPASGTGTWTALNGGTFSNVNAPNATVTGLVASGVYPFVWTIINGSCIAQDTIVITLNSTVIANAGSDQNLCNVTTSTLNGNSSAPAIGTWTTSSSATIVNPTLPNTVVNGMQVGIYSFVWTLVNGSCTTSDTVLITIDSLINANAGVDQAVCVGGTVSLSGNTPTIGVGQWTTTSSAIIANPTSASTTVSGLNTFGSYSFVWTINNGTCTSSDTILVQVDSAEIADAGPDQNGCEIFIGNLNAVAPLTSVGAWTSLGAATISNLAAANSAVSNLVYGSNAFVWSVSNGGCTSSDTIIIQVDSIIVANAGVDQLACASSSIALSANAAGSGVGAWTSLGAATLDNPTNPSSTVSNLQIGINTFVWSITNGACNSIDSVAISISPAPVADAGVDQFVPTGTFVILGGFPSASGGTAPYTYEWNPGLTLNDSLVSNPTVTATVTTTYLLTVSDSLGCTSTASITIWVNDPPIVINDTISTGEDTTVVIYVLNNDSDPNNNLDTNALGILQGPFSGSVVIGPGGQIIYTPGPNFNGMDSILYIICDDGMPVYCDSAWIIITINPVNDAPVAVDDYATTPEDSCIQIAILSNDTDVENMIDLSTLVIISSPSNGTYSLDPTTGILTYCPDSNFNGIDTLIYAICDSGYPTPILCDTALVIITVTPVNDLPIAQSDSAIVCGGDIAIIYVRGNDIDPEGDTLTVSIYAQGSQGLAFVGANQEIIYAANFNAAGWDSLQYVVCDQQNPAGCDTAWLYIYIHPLPQVTSTVTPVLCGGDSIGAIDITLSPTGTYSFTWSNGSTDEDVDSLTIGIYNVVILDSNGCVLTYLDTVPGPLLPLSGTIVSQDVLCFGEDNGIIDIQISGGTSPYSYAWNNSSTDEDLDSLAAGIYTVIVTDSNACIYTLTDTIIAPSAALNIALTSTDIVCAGDSTGAMSVTVSGGTPGYNYSWSNGSTTDSLNGIQAGIYTVLVTDSNGCFLSMSDTIFELNSLIVLNATVVDPNCFAGVYGSIQTTLLGGVAPYTYLWNTSDTLTALDSLPAGFYQLLITDSVGCQVVGGYTLVDTSSIAITITGNNIFCEGDSATLSVLSYTGLSYQWMLNGAALLSDTTTQLVVTQGGDYSISAASGCGTFTDGPITVTVNPLPIVDAGTDENVACNDVLTLSATGGLTYSWTPANLCTTPNQSSTLVNTSATNTFTVTTTDANGCTNQDNVIVTSNCNTIVVPTGFSPNNDGFNDNYVISYIDQFPNANLKIFNRWGTLVYEMNSYDNSWTGLSNVDKIGIGEVLPNGTYYYILDLGNDEKPLNGYVIIRR
jgi:gliding motility-associated-like protein